MTYLLKYEVVVDVGQSFASRRDSTVRTLTEMLGGIPPQHRTTARLWV